MKSLFDICNNMTKSYIERSKRSKKKNIPYSDYLLSFDIETTTWEDGTSSVYVWTISGADYNELVNCNCNSDLDRVCDKYTARTLQEFDTALVALNEAAEAANALFLVLIYNLAYEWSYISKNCDFFINSIDLDYPTVLEGRHNAMSVKAGNLVLLDATRIFGLGSLKQNAAKYGFEKLDYDYEVKRHQKTPLTEQDYIYNFYNNGDESQPSSTKIKKGDTIVEYNYKEDGSISNKDFYKLSDEGEILSHSRTDQYGNTQQLSSSSYNADGSFQTNKNFTSPNGTETNYSYKKAPDGSSSLVYNIVDKNGNVLMNTTRTYEKISDNEAEQLKIYQDADQELRDQIAQINERYNNEEKASEQDDKEQE